MIRLCLGGALAIHDVIADVRFVMPSAGRAIVEIFDVGGRQINTAGPGSVRGGFPRVDLGWNE